MLIQEYLTVGCNQLDGLEEIVNEKIAEGWQPYWPQYQDRDRNYLQVMVKYKTVASENGIATKLPISMGM